MLKSTNNKCGVTLAAQSAASEAFEAAVAVLSALTLRVSPLSLFCGGQVWDQGRSGIKESPDRSPRWPAHPKCLPSPRVRPAGPSYRFVATVGSLRMADAGL